MFDAQAPGALHPVASMKGPSRRRGNPGDGALRAPASSLNEGPLQKEGQCVLPLIDHLGGRASMKGPSRRRGNRP